MQPIVTGLGVFQRTGGGVPAAPAPLGENRIGYDAGCTEGIAGIRS